MSEDDADDDEEVDEDFECEDDEGLLMEGYGEEEEMRSSCLLVSCHLVLFSFEL